MGNTHDMTAVAEALSEQAVSVPAGIIIAQHEAIHRREQETMDRLLAERLAETEQADQRTLQEQTQEDSTVLVIPDGLECPITSELFKDPVMCTDGHTYERAAILAWFEEQRKHKPDLTSPMTNAVLESDKVFPNFALRKQCEAFAGSPAYVKHMEQCAEKVQREGAQR